MFSRPQGEENVAWAVWYQVTMRGWWGKVALSQKYVERLAYRCMSWPCVQEGYASALRVG